MKDWYAEQLLAQKLTGYTVLRPLARSHTTEVFLGEHAYLKTQVAIKLFSHPLLPAEIQSFEKRIQAIARLEHPHIVRLLEYTLLDNHPCLVTEFASHGTLRERHPQGTQLTLATLANYLKQISPALQYSHEQHIAHGDLKPENLLLNAGDEILLHDFGFAPPTSGVDSQAPFGTVFYMAPEQLQGQPATPASDQYALAIALWEWLTGYLPFQGTSAEIIAQHMAATPPALQTERAGLDSGIADALSIALRKVPEQRFHSIEAFTRAFLQACDATLTHAEGLRTQPSPDAIPTSALPQPFQGQLPVDQALLSTRTPASTLQPDLTQLTTISPERKQPASRRALLYGLGLGIAGLALGGGLFWWSRNALAPARGQLHPTPAPIAPGTLIYKYTGHQSSSAMYLAWSPSGRQICSMDETEIHLWAVGDGGKAVKFLHTPDSLSSPCWSPDEKLLVECACADSNIPVETVINLRNPATGQLLKQFPLPQVYAIGFLSWLSDNQHIRLLTISTDIQPVALQEWNVLNGTVTQNTPLTQYGSIVQSYELEKIGGFGLSDDGKYVLVADPMMRIKNIATGEIISTLDPPVGVNAIQSISWSQKNERLAIKEYNTSIYDIRSGKRLSQSTDRDTTPGPGAISPDGKYVAFNLDKVVIVLDATTGQKLLTYHGHLTPVTVIAWSPDSKRLATACSNGSGSQVDRSVQVWQAIAV